MAHHWNPETGVGEHRDEDAPATPAKPKAKAAPKAPAKPKGK